jgi:hypothetical protein
MILVTMSVFGAASMAVAGVPITTITTTTPRLHRLERPIVHVKKPDLIPQVSDPFNGIIKVKNQGGATAGASKLTVNCKKIGGGFVSAGDCPSTPALDSLPSDSSGALVVSVPALHVGQVYTISLPVQGLKWGKGKTGSPTRPMLPMRSLSPMKATTSRPWFARGSG